MSIYNATLDIYTWCGPSGPAQQAREGESFQRASRRKFLVFLLTQHSWALAAKNTYLQINNLFIADGRGLSIWTDLTPDSSSQLFPGYKCRSWIWAWSTPWGFSRRSSWGCFRVLTEWHWRTDLEGARLASCSCSQQPRSPEWHPHFKWTENNFKNISLRSFVWHFDISIEILNSVPVMYREVLKKMVDNKHQFISSDCVSSGK